jgi:hypothetical protein
LAVASRSWRGGDHLARIEVMAVGGVALVRYGVVAIVVDAVEMEM